MARVIDYASLESAAQHEGGTPADVLLISAASLHEDVASQVLSVGEAMQARAIAVVYAYGSGRATQMLRLAGVQLHRELDSRLDLRQMFAALRSAARGEGAPLRDGLWARAAHRFDEGTLVALSARSSTIACECPRHLAELVLKLAAFEAYSDECRTRSTRGLAAPASGRRRESLACAVRNGAGAHRARRGLVERLARAWIRRVSGAHGVRARRMTSRSCARRSTTACTGAARKTAA